MTGIRSPSAKKPEETKAAEAAKPEESKPAAEAKSDEGKSAKVKKAESILDRRRGPRAPSGAREDVDEDLFEKVVFINRCAKVEDTVTCIGFYISCPGIVCIAEGIQDA